MINQKYTLYAFIDVFKDIGDPPSEKHTLERVDNSKGYIKGNVAIICWRCNHIKNDATIEDFKNIIKYMRNHELEQGYKRMAKDPEWSEGLDELTKLQLSKITPKARKIVDDFATGVAPSGVTTDDMNEAIRQGEL